MLLLIAVFLLLLNGFFVAAEFALVKVRVTQLEGMAQAGNSTARMAKHIVEHIDPYLSACQLGITLASLGLGWVGEPAVAHLIEPLLGMMGADDPVLITRTSVVVGFVLISVFHIVVGEIAPKSFALQKPVATSMFVALPMRLLYYIFFPALWLLNGMSNLLLRMLGLRGAVSGHALAITAEELIQMTDASTREGLLPETQGQLLQNVFTFSDRVAREIMVPHNRVFYVDITEEPDAILREVLHNGHSRIPLVEDSLDNVVGVLHIKDILEMLARDGKITDLRSIARPPLFVSEHMPASALLKELQTKHVHLAVVVDEYGGVSGIVTIEDVLEELVGEIQDEYDDAEIPLIQPIDGGGYRVDGTASFHELEKLLGWHDTDLESDTVGGFVVERLQRMPQEGDAISYNGWHFEVETLDGLRIGSLALRPLTEDELEAIED